MPRLEIDLNPVERITTDAIGQPGQRVFYIQGQRDDQVVTLLVEKVQIQTLALGVEEFLVEITQRFSDLEEASETYNETDMHILPPVDPLFRVGELALAYDSDADLAILVAHEILAPDMPEIIEDEIGSQQPDEEGADDEDMEEGSVVRFWCTRSQLRGMARWGLEVTGRGRPVCPYCGQPMDPEGHFCPKRNGHKH